MKYLGLVVVCALFAASDVLAQSATVVQTSRGGLFGQRRNTTVATVNGAGASVAVANGRRNNVAVVANSGGANVVVANGRRSSVAVAANGGGANVAVASGRRNGAAVVAVNGFRPAVVSARVNVFGTRTAVVNTGHILEVDAYGHAAVRGNAFNRGFNNAFFYSAAVNPGFYSAPVLVDPLAITCP